MVIRFLKEDQQLLIETLTSRRVINGPKTVFVNPAWRVKRRNAIMLGPTDYIQVRDNLTGELKNVLGPCLYFLAANESVEEEYKALSLQHNEYIQLLNKQTGVIRVERGEALVYLEPTEEIVSRVQRGINIDEETAVLVRDIRSGVQTLITEQQVFIPNPYQEILEKRTLIRLESHETLVIVDEDGNYHFKHGRDDNHTFFLEPYHNILKLFWSAGLTKDRRSLEVSKIDSRPKFMWYEFEVRTRDNVELILNITFFWQIVDVEQMLKTTDDTTGDICSHARSRIMQAVSKVTLENFLDGFNVIVGEAVLDDADTFYRLRGSNLHSVEIRSIVCKDESTQLILQEIIQETTNRINRLQQQQSENEIRIERLQGELNAEQVEYDLVQLRNKRLIETAQGAGQAEAETVLAFLTGIGGAASDADKLAILTLLRKKEILEALSQGRAQIYFTPSDVNLSIET